MIYTAKNRGSSLISSRVWKIVCRVAVTLLVLVTLSCGGGTLPNSQMTTQQSATIASSPDSTPTFTVLYTFMGPPNDGSLPAARLIQDASGNLYGTTQVGAAHHCGSIFKLDATGKETILHEFDCSDGSSPEAGLVRDAAGNLYGDTFGGGICNFGVIFKLDNTDQLTVLHSFTDSDHARRDGRTSFADLIVDPLGNFFGTTVGGGGSQCFLDSFGNGCGTIFKLDPVGNETLLHVFTLSDGAYPMAGLVRDAAGNLYGTTSRGGSGCSGIGPPGCGTVFKLDATGTLTALHIFTGFDQSVPDGAFPQAGLLQDASGNFYGTTSGGGLKGGCGFGCGTVFKLDPTGKETILYSFTGGADGAEPIAPLVLDSSGNLYGTTQFGGTGKCLFDPFLPGCGTVFKVDPTGKETVLYTFMGGADGNFPVAGLFRDASGNLYGTASQGGNFSCNAGFGNPGCGTIFKVTP